MKNARPWLIILISVLMGAAAVVVAARWIAQQANVATQKVVVAKQDLEVGTRLRPELLQVVEWPTGAPLKEPFSTPETLSERVVNTQVLRGEPILAAKLAAPGEKGGLSAVLAEGKRAITVKVNEIVGVAGFALPGNYVDVMVNTPDEGNKPVSKIVLERILVLAVAQDTSAGDAKARVVNAVTLEVSPEQAEQIDLARSIGQLSLVLRSQSDKASYATLGARKGDLLQQQRTIAMSAPPATAAAAAPAPAPAVKQVAARPKAKQPAAAQAPQRAPVEVIRGMKRSSETAEAAEGTNPL